MTNANRTNEIYQFFLGGYDLEMQTLSQLLHAQGQPLVDKHLNWGASAIDYRDEISEALTQGYTPVLIELSHTDGLQGVICIDHHGSAAGHNKPCSLRQVFDLLQLPESQWSRYYQLVAANDIGHTPAMKALGASQAEIQAIRQADRTAQGITPEQEATADAALQLTQQRGEITIVELPHNRVACITDRLDPNLGGPGYQTLWVRSPEEENVFASGEVIQRLATRFPQSWWGGALPQYGFWGKCGRSNEIIELL